MAEPKTKATGASVASFLGQVTDERRRAECRVVMAMMKKATGAPAKMWGPGIVGFGSYHYVYASGREGDWPITGFSPRKQALTLYLMPGLDCFPELMEKR